eukprot:g6158.t1
MLSGISTHMRLQSYADGRYRSLSNQSYIQIKLQNPDSHSNSRKEAKQQFRLCFATLGRLLNNLVRKVFSGTRVKKDDINIELSISERNLRTDEGTLLTTARDGESIDKEQSLTRRKQNFGESALEL